MRLTDAPPHLEPARVERLTHEILINVTPQEARVAML